MEDLRSSLIHLRKERKDSTLGDGHGRKDSIFCQECHGSDQRELADP